MKEIDFTNAIAAFNHYQAIRKTETPTNYRTIKAANALKHELNLCFSGSSLPLKFRLDTNSINTVFILNFS